jgi:hypothetical protein
MLRGRPRQRHRGPLSRHQAVLPIAEFLRRGRPLGLANAPSSRLRSCRIGCTRIILPSLDSCTDPATIETSTCWRAQRRPAAYGVPAKLTTPAASASRVTVSPAVASRARRATPRPRRPVRLVIAEPLRVGDDHHPGVQDVHQAAGHHHLDRLPGVTGTHHAGEPAQGDLAVRVHPP